MAWQLDATDSDASSAWKSRRKSMPPQNLENFQLVLYSVKTGTLSVESDSYCIGDRPSQEAYFLRDGVMRALRSWRHRLESKLPVIFQPFRSIGE